MNVVSIVGVLTGEEWAPCPAVVVLLEECCELQRYSALGVIVCFRTNM
jgi:hypothetical protein